MCPSGSLLCPNFSGLWHRCQLHVITWFILLIKKRFYVKDQTSGFRSVPTFLKEEDVGGRGGDNQEWHPPSSTFFSFFLHSHNLRGWMARWAEKEKREPRERGETLQMRAFLHGTWHRCEGVFVKWVGEEGGGDRLICVAWRRGPFHMQSATLMRGRWKLEGARSRAEEERVTEGSFVSWLEGICFTLPSSPPPPPPPPRLHQGSPQKCHQSTVENRTSKPAAARVGLVDILWLRPSIQKLFDTKYKSTQRHTHTHTLIGEHERILGTCVQTTPFTSDTTHLCYL